MNFNITGKHLELTPAIKEAVVYALEHSKKMYDEIIDVNVILTHDHHEFVAEAVLHVAGKNVFVKSCQKNMYDAITDMGEKALHSLQKIKGKKSKISHYNPKRMIHEVLESE